MLVMKEVVVSFGSRAKDWDTTTNTTIKSRKQLVT